MDVVIYSDGAARGNPGRGGYGTIIVYEDSEGNKFQKELTAGYIKTTNNRMELLGAIRGLQALNTPCKVSLYSDSQYLCNAFNKGWIWSWLKKKWKKADGQSVKNVDLWKDLLKLVKIHEVKFIWIKGHDGNEFNERCDKLATDSADNNATLEDKNYSDEGEVTDV